MNVKICGITREDDALAAEQAGATAVGFVFAAGSKRLVTPARAREIGAVLGPFIARVGVFVGATAEEVLDVAHAARLSAVQLHGREGPDVAAAIRRELPVIRALPHDAARTPADWADYPADAILLDAAEPGSGVPFSWDDARSWRGHPRLVLAGGLTPENVADGVRALDPWAVDVSSGVEAGPGLKDPDAVRRFVVAANSRGA